MPTGRGRGADIATVSAIERNPSLGERQPGRRHQSRCLAQRSEHVRCRRNMPGSTRAARAAAATRCGYVPSTDRADAGPSSCADKRYDFPSIATDCDADASFPAAYAAASKNPPASPANRTRDRLAHRIPASRWPSWLLCRGHRLRACGKAWCDHDRRTPTIVVGSDGDCGTYPGPPPDSRRIAEDEIHSCGPVSGQHSQYPPQSRPWRLDGRSLR